MILYMVSNIGHKANNSMNISKVNFDIFYSRTQNI